MELRKNYLKGLRERNVEAQERGKRHYQYHEQLRKISSQLPPLQQLSLDDLIATAEIYETLQETENAVNTCRQILELSPDNFWAYTSLIRSSLKSTDALQQGPSLISEAITATKQERKISPYWAALAMVATTSEKHKDASLYFSTFARIRSRLAKTDITTMDAVFPLFPQIQSSFYKSDNKEQFNSLVDEMVAILRFEAPFDLPAEITRNEIDGRLLRYHCLVRLDGYGTGSASPQLLIECLKFIELLTPEQRSSSSAIKAFDFISTELLHASDLWDVEDINELINQLQQEITDRNTWNQNESEMLTKTLERIKLNHQQRTQSLKSLESSGDYTSQTKEYDLTIIWRKPLQGAEVASLATCLAELPNCDIMIHYSPLVAKQLVPVTSIANRKHEAITSAPLETKDSEDSQLVDKERITLVIRQGSNLTTIHDISEQKLCRLSKLLPQH